MYVGKWRNICMKTILISATAACSESSPVYVGKNPLHMYKINPCLYAKNRTSCYYSFF